MARIDLQHVKSFEKERKEVLRAAKQLCYPDEILEKIMKAKTPNELTRIMKDARGSR